MRAAGVSSAAHRFAPRHALCGEAGPGAAPALTPAALIGLRAPGSAVTLPTDAARRDRRDRYRRESRRPPGPARALAKAILLALAAFVAWGSTGCGMPPARSAAPTGSEEQRLLGRVIRRQEERVAAVAAAAAAVADELDALAEPQRILDPRGRPDLAAA